MAQDNYNNKQSASNRPRDDEGRFISQHNDQNYDHRSASNNQQNQKWYDDSRNSSGRSSEYNQQGQGRGWYGDPEGHAQAGRHSHDHEGNYRTSHYNHDNNRGTSYSSSSSSSNRNSQYSDDNQEESFHRNNNPSSNKMVGTGNKNHTPAYSGSANGHRYN